MKTNYILLLSSALTLLAGCNDKIQESPDIPDSGKAYMSISLAGTPGGKADPGTITGEDYVNDVHILYFDVNNMFLGESGKILRSELTVATSNYKTKVLEVPGATKKAFVIVNNYGSDGTTARFTIPGNSDIGRSWIAINETLSFTPTAIDGVNEFIANHTGQQNGQDNFVMANFGVRWAAGPAINPNDNGLVDVETGKDAAEAGTKTNTITVDRLSSKVTFAITAKAGGGADEVLANPATAQFFFLGWEMNATNRKMRLYSEHDAAYTQADENGAKVAYRKDANYILANYGTPSNAWAGYADQFTYLRNTSTDGSTGNTSAVSRANNTVAYCPENTMTADAQVIGATTKVVVKGNYVPPGYTKGGTYFTYDGNYYKLNEIQALYKAARDAGNTGGIVADLKDFLIACGLATSTNTDTEIDDIVVKFGQYLDADTGIKAREKNAVRFFFQGVSYYEVLIRHDSRITATMALGKYGVVRNNWYTLTLNSVSRPGVPWIPGGPEDPITPPDTPDDNTAMLEVTITVLPWVTWNQLVDL